MTDPVRSQSDPDSKSRKKKIESLEIEEEREPDNSNTRRGSGATCYGPDAVSVSLGGKATKKKKKGKTNRRCERAELRWFSQLWEQFLRPLRMLLGNLRLHGSWGYPYK
jgi:hypothetical protein